MTKQVEIASNLRCVKFKKDHLKMMEDSGENMGITQNRVGIHGPAFTGLIGNRIIAIGGISIMWPRVGEAFIFATPLIKKYPVFFTSSVIRNLKKIEADHKLHRVQAAVLRTDIRACFWIECVGFNRMEGILEKYTPQGRDCFLYARIKKWPQL